MMFKIFNGILYYLEEFFSSNIGPSVYNPLELLKTNYNTSISLLIFRFTL